MLPLFHRIWFSILTCTWCWKGHRWSRTDTADILTLRLGHKWITKEFISFFFSDFNIESLLYVFMNWFFFWYTWNQSAKLMNVLLQPHSDNSWSQTLASMITLGSLFSLGLDWSIMNYWERSQLSSILLRVILLLSQQNRD